MGLEGIKKQIQIFIWLGGICLNICLKRYDFLIHFSQMYSTDICTNIKCITLEMYYYYFFMCGCFVCLHVPPGCMAPTEVRRGHWIPWDWSCRELWVVMWVPEIKPKSCGNTASILPMSHFSSPKSYNFNYLISNNYM